MEKEIFKEGGKKKKYKKYRWTEDRRLEEKRIEKHV